MISLRIDAKSGVPPYLQIAQQIRQALVAGVLVPGDQLPTVKQVVTNLAVNPNTVFKSYRELEHEGLVEGRPGAGTFVLRRPPGPPPGTHAALAARWCVGWNGPAPPASTTARSSRCCARRCTSARRRRRHDEPRDRNRRPRQALRAHVGVAQLLDHRARRPRVGSRRRERCRQDDPAADARGLEPPE